MFCTLRAFLLCFLLAGISIAFQYGVPLRRLALGDVRYLTLSELTADVTDRPVVKKCPEVLKNIYFGLRHGMVSISSV